MDHTNCLQVAIKTHSLNLQRVAVKHDPEHLASLQSLMVIYNKGGNTWKDWVTNQLHQPDWKDKSIKIADVTKSILQAKSFGHTAQASSGEEKVHFLCRGRGGGQRGARGAREGARGGRGGGPPVCGVPSNFRPKICEKVSCTRPVTSPQHRFCTMCFKTVKKSEQEEQITVILVQMLKLKFAVRDTSRTRSNVLRMLPDGVMQQQHMRSR